MDEKRKDIDESWKEAVEKEKEGLKAQGKFVPPEATFTFFITTLALQASISMGLMENPATNKKEEDPQQARFLIDTIEMIKVKTAGNLSAEENKLLEDILYELRMQYISKNKNQGAAQ
ncbi:MAG: DUF1844 domain-containing protein [Candidatus Omnitrophica bacterium]|nr:DUF1844 domain-containing protein [Candidatus Omnitrophota bacterium]MDD5512389.1 DUF1844 domain-containing protein [Candidatus Omnitrophota bacterium]